MANKLIAKLLVCVAILISAIGSVYGCSRSKEFSFDELFVADVVVTAVAAKYAVAPRPEDYTTTGIPDSTIVFKISEVLRGVDVGSEVILSGYLSDQDDFNDQLPPYRFVRDNGRQGSCFANTYKTGGEFLLFLKKKGNVFTSNISALGPTNEQLTGKQDPWLQWVRTELKIRNVPAKPRS